MDENDPKCAETKPPRRMFKITTGQENNEETIKPPFRFQPIGKKQSAISTLLTIA